MKAVMTKQPGVLVGSAHRVVAAPRDAVLPLVVVQRRRRCRCPAPGEGGVAGPMVDVADLGRAPRGRLA
jgi:hypothetical protein